MDNDQVQAILLGILTNLNKGDVATATKLCRSHYDEILATNTNRFGYRPEHSMIDMIKAFEVLQDFPYIEYDLYVIHRTRYDGISLEFSDWMPLSGTPEGQANTLNAWHDHWQKTVSNTLCGEDVNDVPGWWMLIGLIGTNPPQEMLNAFLDGRLRITNLDETEMQMIFSNWPAFLNNPKICTLKP